MAQQLERPRITRDVTAVEEFRAGLRGDLLQPGDAGYDAARAVYNAMIDKRPALIARCTGVADVIQAVQFGRAHELPTTVRAGGHNVAGASLVDGGLVIDLTRMRGVRVDPVARTVRVEGGALWRDVDRETQAFGLATTGGTVSDTGVAGLTLGGGLGWLMRKHGLALDNLLSVDVVMADGGFLTASATQNADLFWAMRGAGANFGVATSFEFRLHPVGPMLAGMVVHPIDRAQDVLQFLREYLVAAPDEVAVFAAMVRLPDGMPVIGVLACYVGPVDEGEHVLRLLRDFGPPMADQIQVMPYAAFQQIMDESLPRGLHNYWKAGFLNGLPDAAIDRIVASFHAARSPLNLIGLEPFGGAMSRIAKDATAFAHRDGAYELLIMGRWADPAEAPQHTSWARSSWDAMRPFAANAAYVNHLADDEPEERIRSAYGPNYGRLVALKNAYDPTNFFRGNQNIKPTV